MKYKKSRNVPTLPQRPATSRNVPERPDTSETSRHVPTRRNTSRNIPKHSEIKVTLVDFPKVDVSKKVDLGVNSIFLQGVEKVTAIHLPVHDIVHPLARRGQPVAVASNDQFNPNADED